MPNTTCRLLSNGYKFDLSNDNKFLNLRPCCLSRDAHAISLEDINTDSISQYRHQLNLLDSYKHPGCEQCNFQTNNALRKTWRDLSFDIIPHDAELGDASYLELQLDKTCNGGCVVCGPYHSSFWQHEIGSYTPSVVRSVNSIVQNILKIVDITKTRRILFLGGEPLLSKVDEIVIEHIPDPSIVDLQYTTNGSVYPSARKIAEWSRFRSVLLNFSIDGIGDRFNYIRYPLQWHQVWQNMQRMLQELPNNVRFKINHTVNILNLYYHDEFDSWKSQYYSQDRHGKDIMYTFNPASGILAPTAVPLRMWNIMLQKYASDSKPVKVMQTQTKDFTEVLEHLDRIDQRRNTNWRSTFPDIADCFQ